MLRESTSRPRLSNGRRARFVRVVGLAAALQQSYVLTERFRLTQKELRFIIVIVVIIIQRRAPRSPTKDDDDDDDEVVSFRSRQRAPSTRARVVIPFK